MKPIYSNAFSATKNTINGELTLEFKHSYPKSREVRDGVIETDTKTEDIISLVLNTTGAAKLHELLTKVLSN